MKLKQKGAQKLSGKNTKIANIMEAYKFCPRRQQMMAKEVCARLKGKGRKKSNCKTCPIEGAYDKQISEGSNETNTNQE